MTIKELKQYPALCKEISDDEKEIISLRQKLNSLSVGPSLSGMPHGNKFESPVERLIFEIDDLERAYLKKCRRRDNLKRYIDEIEDTQIKLIIKFHFIKGLTWQQTAQKIGGNNTKDSVRKAAYRFVK